MDRDDYNHHPAPETSPCRIKTSIAQPTPTYKHFEHEKHDCFPEGALSVEDASG
jgi:hypothetical protein